MGAPAETEIAMVRRHVREGEAHVARQRQILEELFEGGHDTAMAERLLLAFEGTLAEHHAHLARLLARG